MHTIYSGKEGNILLKSENILGLMDFNSWWSLRFVQICKESKLERWAGGFEILMLKPKKKKKKSPTQIKFFLYNVCF